MFLKQGETDETTKTTETTETDETSETTGTRGLVFGLWPLVFGLWTLIAPKIDFDRRQCFELSIVNCIIVNW